MIETIIEISVFIWALATLYGYKEKIKKRLLWDLELKHLKTYLIVLIKLTPENKETILITYDEYKRAGGNGYIDLMFNEWKTKYLSPTK
jgi:hypothetical protein